MGSVHNELRRAGGLLVGIKRILGVDASDGGVERFSETLQAIVDPWRQPEFAWARGERLAGRGSVYAAVAAQFTIGILTNPAGSGVLIITEKFHVANQGYVIQMCANTEGIITGSALDAPGTIRDSRLVTNNFQSVRGQLRSNSSAAFLFPSLYNVDTAVHVDLPIVLHPGYSLLFEGIILNTSLQLRVAWREKPLLPGELP